MPHRVLVPRGPPLDAYLRLRRWELARRLLRSLSTEPRPRWAHQVAGGWKVDLGGGEWLLYQLDEPQEQITIVHCHAA